MNAITLESLGLSSDDISNRVIDRLVEKLLWDVDGEDENGEPVTSRSKFSDALKERVRQRIDTAIDEVAAKHVLPNVAAYLETFTMQRTSEWGEKKSSPMTFVEYLVERANAYLGEKVDFEGKTKQQAGSYSWNGTQTRITNLVEKHLHYSIETAMKAALADANSQIAGGIAETVKTKLAEITGKLKVTATVK